MPSGPHSYRQYAHGHSSDIISIAWAVPTEEYAKTRLLLKQVWPALLILVILMFRQARLARIKVQRSNRPLLLLERASRPQPRI